MENEGKTIYTIGHSTRPLNVFIDLLKESGITLMVDIRTVPRSARNPQYNIDSLPESLKSAAGVKYRHMAGLGGFRRPHPDSVNMGLQNENFRGYADYMQTAEFEKSLRELIALAEVEKIALMCAEAVPWHCHRSILSDALTARGFCVVDILGPGETRIHTLSPFARVDGTKISYPALI